VFVTVGKIVVQTVTQARRTTLSPIVEKVDQQAFGCGEPFGNFGPEFCVILLGRWGENSSIGRFRLRIIVRPFDRLGLMALEFGGSLCKKS
jgi:hypothetical protein